MCQIYLNLIVGNIKYRDSQKEISFRVDTGVTRAWIPQQDAMDLDITPIGEFEMQVAGGVKTFPYGACLFDFGGEIVAGNIVIGPSDTKPFVGTHVLQDFRLVIDMDHHTISRKRAMKAR